MITIHTAAERPDLWKISNDAPAVGPSTTCTAMSSTAGGGCSTRNSRSSSSFFTTMRPAAVAARGLDWPPRVERPGRGAARRYRPGYRADLHPAPLARTRQRHRRAGPAGLAPGSRRPPVMAHPLNWSGHDSVPTTGAPGRLSVTWHRARQGVHGAPLASSSLLGSASRRDSRGHPDHHRHSRPGLADLPPVADHGTAGLGDATIVLYLAVSLGVQRLVVHQRAQRLQQARPVAQPAGRPDPAAKTAIEAVRRSPPAGAGH